MNARSEESSRAAIVDAEDRAYVESLAPGPERDTVIASLLRYRNPEALQVGDLLPTVTVRGADNLQPIELAGLVRDRPLLFVFGSYTWPPFRRRSGDVESLFQRFRDRADFAFVYIAEAHAANEWQLAPNLEEGAILDQQLTLEERRTQAHETAARLGLTMPLFLDEMSNLASVAFAAWPERLVLVSRDRRIADPGKPGPWGFSPEETEERLITLLSGAGRR